MSRFITCRCASQRPSAAQSSTASSPRFQLNRRGGHSGHEEFGTPNEHTATPLRSTTTRDRQKGAYILAASNAGPTGTCSDFRPRLQGVTMAHATSSVVYLLVCLVWLHAAADAQLSRRSLLQAGPALFMSLPILDDADVVTDEAGPAPPKHSIKQATNASSAPAATAARPAAASAAAGVLASPRPQQQQQQQQQKQGQPKPKQPRNLLAANTHGHKPHHHDKRWRQERLAHYRRYDRSTLSPLLSPVNTYSGVSPQPLPALTGLLATLLQPGDPRLSAQKLAGTVNRGNSDAAAQAIASAAVGSGGAAQASAVAQALTETAANYPSVAPGLLARSSNLAVTRGQTQPYASTLAQAFGYAKQQQRVPQLTSALCEAINRGGDSARYASGTAIAKAIAQGGDSKAAVAEATATAFCEGGSTAQAWASAYAIALSKDSQGCLVLNEAKAMAQARCGEGVGSAVADAEASSTVLGFCGLLEGLFADMDMSWSGGSSWSGNGGSSRLGGSTGFGQQGWGK